MKIIIKGVPLQKQSLRFSFNKGFVRKYQPKKVVQWAAQARAQVISQLPDDFELYYRDIKIISVLFVFPPLKNWPKYKLKALEEGEVIYKNTKPDLDNLFKSLLDVCNGLVWTDDARIVSIKHSKKVFGLEPRIELEVEK